MKSLLKETKPLYYQDFLNNQNLIKGSHVSLAWAMFQ